MSYKRNSKSRIARLLLALTLMGGVGQRITNNISYAMNIASLNNNMNNMKNGFQASNGSWGSFEELDIDDLDNPVGEYGDLTDNAKLFAKLVSCELEVENGKIEGTGEVTRPGVYNVNALKNTVFGVFSNMNNDGCFWPRYIKSYGAINGFDFYAVAKLLLAGVSPVGFQFSASQKQDVYNIFSTNEGFKVPFAEVEGNSLALQNFINGLTDPKSDYSSVMMIGKNGSVVVKNGEDLETGELEEFDGVSLYSTAKVAIDFGGVKLAENEVGSIKGTIDSFSPKEKGNFKHFNGVNFKIKVSGSDDVKGFATLMAINTYLEVMNESEDVGAAVLEASQKYRNIVTSSICKKTQDEFEKDYDTVTGISKEKFPSSKKAEAVKFVLLVQNFYNSVGGLKPNFTTGDFAGALKTKDPLVRLIQMICKAFQGQDLTNFTSGMADDTCKEFLRYELNGDGGAGGGKKISPSGKSDKPGPGQPDSGKPGQPGEKKGLSTGAKVAMGITIPAAVLAAAGVALWKTGYGAKIWGKIKTLMNKDGNRRPDIKFNSQGKEPVVKN